MDNIIKVKPNPFNGSNIPCDCSLCIIDGTTVLENSSSVKRFFKCFHVICSKHFNQMIDSGTNLICPECRAPE